jgi:hypothetical protein
VIDTGRERRATVNDFKKSGMTAMVRVFQALIALAIHSSMVP